MANTTRPVCGSICNTTEALFSKNPLKRLSLSDSALVFCATADSKFWLMWWYAPSAWFSVRDSTPISSPCASAVTWVALPAVMASHWSAKRSMRAAMRRPMLCDTRQTMAVSSAPITSASISSRSTGAHHGFCVECSQTDKSSG